MITACAILALTLAAHNQEPEMAAITNPSFESLNANGAPRAWRSQTWGGAGQFTIVDGGRSGKCALVSSENGVDGGWQTNLSVKPFSTYRISAWIKTDGVTATTGQGALLNLHSRPERTQPLTGTRDWTQVSMDVETGGDDRLTLNCLLGYYGSAKGKAYFDDLDVRLLSTRELKPEATIDIAKTREPISKYVYGQFIEHLGRCIYGGIWSEMLEDRKFFFKPGTRPSPWTTFGNDGVIWNDAEPFSGEHDLRLFSEDDTAGIRQSGLWLESGRSYVGYVWLKADSDTGPVRVTLNWGEGAGGKQVHSIQTRDRVWTRYPFRFQAGRTTQQGALAIESSGQLVRIGAASLMPADNVRGMRADTLKLLKELDAPIYRWPGGNFVSGYEWRDGIGDRDRRPTRKNPAWQGIDSNDFGLHEFLDFCKEIGTEPEIVVSTGFGDSYSAAQQVEYVNGASDTPMGKLRTANGRKDPWNVLWWSIGNEMYGSWQLGHIPLSQYTIKHNDFVRRMKAVDPKIKLIAVGDSGSGWTKGMFEQSSADMNLISEHFYCQERPGVYGHTSQIADQIRAKVRTHRELMGAVSQVKGKNIRISMDEWNYWYGPHVFGELGTRYFWKDGMGIARGLHEFYRASDVVFMANYAQTVNVIGCIKTSPTHAEMETTGLILALYRRHFGTIPVEVSGAPEPLDVSAALTSDRKALTLAVVNATAEAVDLPVQFAGNPKLQAGQVWTIANPDPQAYNDPGSPRKVDTVRSNAALPTGKIRCEGYSVQLFRWPIG